MADVTHAAEKMTRAQADPIVKKLMDKYRDGQASLKKGKPFNEVYNQETLEPTPEWLGMYEEVKEELISMGVPLGRH